jgi:hypothetical protein
MCSVSASSAPSARAWRIDFVLAASRRLSHAGGHPSVASCSCLSRPAPAHLGAFIVSVACDRSPHPACCRSYPLHRRPDVRALPHAPPNLTTRPLLPWPDRYTGITSLLSRLIVRLLPSARYQHLIPRQLSVLPRCTSLSAHCSSDAIAAITPLPSLPDISYDTISCDTTQPRSPAVRHSIVCAVGGVLMPQTSALLEGRLKAD